MTIANGVVRCKCGPIYIEVTADTHIGPYAVHKTIRQKQAQGPGWTVTHRDSGLAVWQVREERDAIRVASWLDAEGILPDNHVITLTARERVQLIEKLSAIAPRYWGEETQDDHGKACKCQVCTDPFN